MDVSRDGLRHSHSRRLPSLSMLASKDVNLLARHTGYFEDSPSLLRKLTLDCSFSASFAKTSLIAPSKFYSPHLHFPTIHRSILPNISQLSATPEKSHKKVEPPTYPFPPISTRSLGSSECTVRQCPTYAASPDTVLSSQIICDICS